MSNEFVEYQIRCAKVLEMVMQDLKRRYSSLPIFSIQMEYEIQDWMKFGNVGGVQLRGMPILDIVILFLGHPKPKIGIQLDGEVHRGFKTLIDKDQKIVLDKRWGHLIRIIKDEDERCFTGTSKEIGECLLERILPIFKKYDFLR